MKLTDKEVNDMLIGKRSAPPTVQQTKFIRRIATTLGLNKPNCRTRRGASRWINKHIEAYRDATREAEDGFPSSLGDIQDMLNDQYSHALRNGIGYFPLL